MSQPNSAQGVRSSRLASKDYAENFSDLQTLMENIRNVLGSHEQVSLLKAYYSVADNMPEWNKLMPPLVNIDNPKDNKHVTALLDLVGQIDTLIPSSS